MKQIGLSKSKREEVRSERFKVFIDPAKKHFSTIVASHTCAFCSLISITQPYLQSLLLNIIFTRLNSVIKNLKHTNEQ
jgi:hypothetical protein